jgi:phospho-N-acetylmuramoyl-pentapeptide-transferase
MLYHLSRALLTHWGAFNVVHYVSFRACAALMTAFFLSFFFGQAFIVAFRELFKAQAREQTPDSHRIKDNTPTMGGL